MPPKAPDRIQLRLSASGWILSDTLCGVRRLLDVPGTAKVRLKYGAYGFAYLKATDGETGAKLFEATWVTEILCCHLWKVQGQEFIEEILGDGSVKRTWVVDAHKEFYAGYIHRDLNTVPVKTLWYRLARSTGYKLYFSLQTLAAQIERSRQATPSFFQEGRRLKVQRGEVCASPGVGQRGHQPQVGRDA